MTPVKKKETKDKKYQEAIKLAKEIEDDLTNLKNEIEVVINYEKFKQDGLWDGIKGYVTNTTLCPNDVIENYSNLWHIEKAFRISKTDLKIRPIHHYLKHRIEAHISISFIAYTVYKELERIIKIHDKNLSVQKVLEEIKTIYGLEYTNPITNKKKFEVLQLNEIQLKIQNIIDLELG